MSTHPDPIFIENTSTLEVSLEQSEKIEAESELKKKKTKKGDEMRNLYPNSMKCIINSILSEKAAFMKKLGKIRRNLLTKENEIPVEIEDFIDNEFKKLDFNLYR